MQHTLTQTANELVDRLNQARAAAGLAVMMLPSEYIPAGRAHDAKRAARKAEEQRTWLSVARETLQGHLKECRDVQVAVYLGMFLKLPDSTFREALCRSAEVMNGHTFASALEVLLAEKERDRLAFIDSFRKRSVYEPAP